MAIRFKILFIIAFVTIFSARSNGQSSHLGTVCAESSHSYGVTGYDNSDYIWAIENAQVVQGEGEDTISVFWGRSTGTFQMEVVEVTFAGCTGVPVMATVTVQAPEVDLLFDFYEICDEDSLELDASGDYSGDYSILWHNGSTDPLYTAKETELIWVRVTDGLGCVRFDSVDFTVHPLPVVYIGEDTVLCDVQNPLEVTALDADGNSFSTYEWFSAEQGGLSQAPSIYVGPGHDTVTVTITDYNGCPGSDTLVIFACDVHEMFRDMVNTFTPNDDGVNDEWNITPFMYLFPDAVLEVFDRWGRLVYRTDNVSGEPWDGMSNGRQMPMDSYFFVLELNYMNLEALSGTVNLIR